MKEIPQNGSLISYEVIDNFTGESYRVNGRVLACGYEYVKKNNPDPSRINPNEEMLCGIFPGESVAVERANGIIDLVFGFDDVIVIEGPVSEMPEAD